MTDAQAKKLREPFRDEQIGKLPRLTCKACSEGKGQCAQHSKQSCSVCGNWISPQHIHLDYVGHAATTDRLLQVDPDWSWEPMAVGPNGEPLLTNGGLWIKLTVAGVTRPGWGDGSSMKEIIGDAIRNAAMRFGVALDLWAKEDLRSDEGTQPPPADSPPAAEPAASNGAKGDITQPQMKKIGAVLNSLKKDIPDVPDGFPDWTAYAKGWINAQFGKHSRTELSKLEAGKLIEHLEAQEVPFG